MRSLIALLILFSTLALGSSCLAVEVALRKHTVEEVKSACDQVGGRFSQDAGGYECGTNCHGGPGTDCIVNCKATQPCFAQVIGNRRPTTLLNALQTPARGRR
jgi:hypothetical protein